MNARHPARCRIIYFRWDCFAQRVMSFCFPARYQVVFLNDNTAVKFWYFVRTVLQIGIHGDDHRSLGCLEAFVKRCGFSILLFYMYATSGAKNSKKWLLQFRGVCFSKVRTRALTACYASCTEENAADFAIFLFGFVRLSALGAGRRPKSQDLKN